ncbi:Chitinase 1 [Tolypocladium paradoxum]|uniref:chitinase n=1 Tax=Tolypocladium paradoxum TaxID=94208 RepID=A0A2S4KY24_9HYPO|nr:Chitinase 1 [Tolypocladium paradoxum]
MSDPVVNAVYYPSWRVYGERPPSSLRAEIITHVFYAFVGVREDGTFRLLDEWADLDKDVDGKKGCLSALAELKRKNPHLKTLVSLGGASASADFPALAANEGSRQTFARQAREFCDCHNLDGIDVDWEHPTSPEQGRDFVELLRVARDALPSPDYLVTTALTVGEYCLRNIDLVEASAFLDFLNLMAYDFTGNWTKVCGHHAQLLAPTDESGSVHPHLTASCSRGVEYVRSSGVPSNKVLLGIPVYARYFPHTQGHGEAFLSEAGEMDYCDLPDVWLAEARVDEAMAAASFVDAKDGKGFVSFDVPSTVAAKARYAKAMGLGGLFFWTGAGDRPGTDSLVAAGYATLLSDA